MSKKRSAAKPKPPGPLDDLYPLALGAVAGLVALSAMDSNPSGPWTPYSQTGVAFLRVLVFSAVCSGAAAGALGGRRIASTPIPGAACALGWIIWSLSSHVKAQGYYLSWLPAKATAADALVNFLANTQAYGVFAAMGLIVTAITARVCARFFDRVDKPSQTEDSAVGTFRLALSYPALLAALGAGLFLIAGLAGLPFSGTGPDALPAQWPIAIWCGLWIMLPFAAAGAIVRHYFKTTGTAGFLIAPPLAVAAVAALYLAANGHFPLAQPAIYLLWHTSPFEAAAWGALGSAVGHHFANRKTQSG